MPLTVEEREFLDAYVIEVTAEPFGGPAVKDLARRGVRYSDLDWILTAWDRERRAERRPMPTTRNPSPRPSPWATLEEAKRRNEQLRQEWEARSTALQGVAAEKAG